MMELESERVLILDFGSQFTQLIARRLRESGVYCEIWPCTVEPARIEAWAPRAVILSGGPASVHEAESPLAPDVVFRLDVPVLGVCYGEQLLCQQLGGAVEGSDHREFGRAFVDVSGECVLFDGVWPVGSREQVWMSHGDRIVAIPPGFRVVATTENAPFAAIADDARRFYGVQFHPEVVHTPHGAALLRNFTHRVAGLSGSWTMAAFRETEIGRIRAQVGDGRVICGLSGGVDSAVAAVLIHEAIGDQLTCIFVDHGLLRAGEAEQVVGAFRDRFNIKLVHRDASDLFLSALEGVTDPEVKRKTIGRLFIDVFEEEARRLGGADYLAQGTLYPDVIESVSFLGGPLGHDQVASQCRRPARADANETGGTAARVVQGRGARPGADVGHAREHGGTAPLPRPRPRDPYSRRGDAGEAGAAAAGGHDLPGGDSFGGAVRRDLASVCCAAAGAHRRGDGRRADVRSGVRAAGGDVDGWDDGGCVSVRDGVSDAGREPDRQ